MDRMDWMDEVKTGVSSLFNLILKLSIKNKIIINKDNNNGS